MAQRTVSTKLAITGESEYRASLSRINTELKTLQSALKLTESQYQTNANSMAALEAKGKALNDLYTAQKSKVQELRNALDNAKAAEQEYANRKADIQKKIEDNNKALEKLKQTTGDTSKEEARLAEENAKLQKELGEVDAKLQAAEKGTNSWQTQLNNAEVQLNNLDAEIQKNERYMDEAKNSSDGCAKSIDNFGKEVKESTEDTEKQTDALEALATAMASAEVSAAADKIAEGLKACVSAAMDFEYQMSGVGAIASASSEEMDLLSQKAKDIGATTVFTASQAAEAMSYMALAGWDATEMLEGVGGVINLAAASGENLATVSDIVTDALTAFGLEAKDSEHFVDVLAKTAASSNTTVTMLGEAFKYAAPLAGALGYSVEDVSVAMGLMANQGIKGSQAGTTLRTMFTKLSGEVTLSGKAFGEVNISAANSDGTMKTLSQTLGELREYFGQMTDAEKLANAEAVAGKYAMSGLTALMNTTEQDFVDLTNAIADCTGAAKDMADTRLDNLQGDVILLGSAFDGLKIAVGETLEPLLRDIAQAGAEALSKATEFVHEHPLLTEALALTAGGIAGITAAYAALKSAQKVADILGILEPIKNLGEAAKLAGGGISGFVSALGTIAIPAAGAATALLGLITVIDRVKTLKDIGLLGEGHELEEYAQNVDSYREAIERCKENIDSLSQSGGDLTMAYDELSLMETALKNATEEYTAAQEAANQAQEDGAASTQNSVASAEAQALANEAITESLTGIAQSYREAYDACRESLDSQIGLFDQFATKIDEKTDTAVEMLQRWAEQTTNLQLYTENLKRAGELGLDQGLVQSLADGSSQSAGYLAIMLSEIDKCAEGTGSLGTSAEEAVAVFNAAFKGTEEAKDNLATTMTTINENLDNSLREMEEMAAAVNFDGFWEAVDLAFSEVGVNFKEIGKNIGAGTQEGIDTSAADVAASAKQMAEGATKAAKDTLGVQSPSTVFREIGKNLDEGMLQGIKSGSSEIVGAVNEMGQEVTRSMQQSADTASSLFLNDMQQLSNSVRVVLADIGIGVQTVMGFLPENMFYIGIMTIDGMINGLYSESGALYNAMYNIVSQSIQSARNAAAVASPSKKTKEIFEYVGEGMIVGIESKKKDVEEATADVVNSALYIDPMTIKDMSRVISDAVPDYSRLIGEGTDTLANPSGGSGNTYYNNFAFTIETQPGQNSKEIADYVMERMQIELERVQGAY